MIREICISGGRVTVTYRDNPKHVWSMASVEIPKGAMESFEKEVKQALIDQCGAKVPDERRN